MERKDLSILITGATGSFGRKFIEMVLKFQPRRLIVFSRDEVKQLQMRQSIVETGYPVLRYFIGDVRDKERVYRAFQGVDVVIHAAALKQVVTAEYNPLEVIKTNILGAANVIDAAIDTGVKKVIALSSDKAVNPVNLYGATKLCADKLFIAAGVYAGARETKFSVVRYGNVMGSRGSVIPIFLERRHTGVLPITDERMTRFWITLEQTVEFVLRCLELMQGGEIFVPKLRSMRIVDLARALAPNCRHEIMGVRPGEKLHEILITEDEARRTVEFPDFFVVQPGPILHWWSNGHLMGGRPVPENFSYSSDANDWWLTAEELRGILEEDEGETDTDLYPLRTAIA
ncbi:MAG: UDP-N-acetylglucosamine 4,6-dehydratase (inverting) [Deltaproteobacteria bacterium RBG_13_58_19]|nr:MAG: UDP-N-acetylglucosamine 4,6-dehydratase (inverting) [Deltaproteobacteria bacterium RBG_13_58_19]